MFRLKIDGFRNAEELEISDTSKIITLDLKNNYFDQIDTLIIEKDNYSVGSEISEVRSDKQVATPLLFIYGKAESIECGILFSKSKNLKIEGVWPEPFFNAINKDVEIFKSLLYRLVKTPDFFIEVRLFTYTKPIIIEEFEEPKVPKLPTRMPEVSEPVPETKSDEEYVIPQLPYKKKITTKVSIDFNIPKVQTPLEELESIEKDQESYGESLITEIEEIASAYSFEGTKESDVEVEFWDSCPFCFTRLSENTIKLLKAGLSTFCPNSKCRKLIKAELMVKKSKK
ncbi:MAG: hypothetical protein ACTSPY_01125 [Candidatus Helarchaeota archaeon]